MIKLVAISLENELDLVLSHKRSMRLAERLGLTTATQTTFATAVLEIARTVIEHTNDGLLAIGLEQNKTRYTLTAVVVFDKTIRFTNEDAGFYYAQKLVPEFELSETPTGNVITMKMGLPRSLRLDAEKISGLKKELSTEPPINAYEEIKIRNAKLSRLANEKNEELRQSKLIDEQKTEFISIASHELKTPMTVLKAYTQMAQSTKEPVSAHLREVLGKIDLQANKLMALVHQLLDISKIENGNLQYKLEVVPLNHFVSEQVSVMAHILPHHHFTTALSADEKVVMDPLRMEQVLANLLGNAAKYSEKNTAISVTTTSGVGVVTISVTDQGRGMSGETMASVFDKFYRASDVLKSHTGLGMGLYITSKIIADHQGKIWVESSEGSGSTFSFTLPLA